MLILKCPHMKFLIYATVHFPWALGQFAVGQFAVGTVCRKKWKKKPNRT